MKMMLEREHEGERTSPISIAQAVINFSVAEHEDEQLWVENFIELVDYLNVYAQHLKNRRRTNAFWNPDV